MAQVLDFSLTPENEGYALSAIQVLNTIALWEERLLHRAKLEMVQSSVLDKFAQAMRESTNEEWAAFKQEANLVPLEHSDAKRMRG